MDRATVLQTRLDDLLSLLEALKTLDIEQLYARLLDGVLAAIPKAQAGSLIVRQGAYLRFKALRGYSMEGLSAVRFPIEAALNTRYQVSDNVYQMRQANGLARTPLAEVDLALLQQFGRIDEICESLSGGLRMGGELYGLITIDRFDFDDPFDDTDIKLLDLLTDLATHALQNVRTYSRLHELDVMRNQFVATVHHELRTPMTSILGYTELLLEDGGDPVFAKYALQVMHDETKRLAGVIEHLARLDGVQRERNTNVEVDFEAIILDANIKYAQLALGKGIVYQATTLPLPLVSGHPESLKLAVEGLLDNAIKYNAPGATIAVNARVEGYACVLRVTDNGPGLEEQDISRVFEPFYRANDLRNPQSGMGVGLTMARHIMRNHGGDVNAYSDGLGSGTTFVLSVPVK
jgi:signal transduction histidine kinase